MNDSGSSLLQAVSALGTAPGAASRVIVEREGLRIVEEPFLPVTGLRLSRRADAKAAVAQVPGARIEPNAWLVIDSDAPATLTADPGWLVTDVSSRFAAFRLTGPQSQSLLDAAISVQITPGSLVRTLFAETTTVLLQRFDVNDFRLLVDVSLATYLADWLADAALHSFGRGSGLT